MSSLNLWHPPPDEEVEFEEAQNAHERLLEALERHHKDGITLKCPGWDQVDVQPCTACATWYNDAFYIWHQRMVINRRTPPGW